MTTRRECGSQCGFAVVSAIFIVVALAALGAFIATVSSTQHVGNALDIEGARGYQAARAGVEWGISNALAGNCVGDNIGPLNGMTITVECTAEAAGDATETGLGTISRIQATACNQPSAGACPGNAGSATYVERRLEALVER